MSEKRFYVYGLTDPRKEDQLFYIGKGTGNRCYTHLKKQPNCSNVFKTRTIEAIHQAGLEPGILFLIENLDEDSAFVEESKLIRQYGRRNIDAGGILTNLVVSGTGGRGHSQETREKMSRDRKGRPSNRTPEGHASMVKAVTERVRSPEEILANTERCIENAKKLKGRPWSAARRAAYLAKPPVQSAESNEARSKALKGRKTSSGMSGHRHSEETKQKMSKAARSRTSRR